jgi:hypothetical protein
MYILETISVVTEWYLVWLGFVYYGADSDTGDAVLNYIPATPTLLAIYSMDDILSVIRLGIADSLMVGYPSLCTIVMEALIRFLGLEMLGYL